MSKNHKKVNNYYKYIKSHLWGLKKYLVLQKSDNKCELCFKGNIKLSVHHLNYENLGNERNEDLMVLCNDCHHLLDQDKKAKVWAFCQSKSNIDKHLNILESYCICCLQCNNCLKHCNCSVFLKFIF